MTVLDKIKAFFKRTKPEAKGAEKKPTEAPEKKEVSGETQKGGERSKRLDTPVTKIKTRRIT